jgi:hypothetical protein
MLVLAGVAVALIVTLKGLRSRREDPEAALPAMARI